MGSVKRVELQAFAASSWCYWSEGRVPVDSALGSDSGDSPSNHATGVRSTSVSLDSEGPLGVLSSLPPAANGCLQ